MEHMTEHERDYFSRQLLRAMCKLPHSISVPCWDKTGWAKMRNSILGKYNHITRRVTLNIKYRHSPEYLFSTLCHELHHKWQHETMGARYVLLANFITRDRYLERTAREVEKAADKLIRMEGLRDGDGRRNILQCQL
jgi:hypothetical protein